MVLRCSSSAFLEGPASLILYILSYRDNARRPNDKLTTDYDGGSERYKVTVDIDGLSVY